MLVQALWMFSLFAWYDRVRHQNECDGLIQNFINQSLSYILGMVSPLYGLLQEGDITLTMSDNSYIACLHLTIHAG